MNHVLIYCNLPARLQLKVSFSPLHRDDHHPIENKETGAWNSIVRKEQGNGERQVHITGTCALKELSTHTLMTLQSSLKYKPDIKE